MTNEKIIEFFSVHRVYLLAYLVEGRFKDGRSLLRRLADMCDEGIKLAKQDDERALLWLGYVQGAMVASGLLEVTDEYDPEKIG